METFALVYVGGRTTALVHVPDSSPVRPEQAPASPAKSVFGRFMALLVERYTEPSVSAMTGGIAFWTGLPVEEIVLSGLWVVMKKVAEAAGITMTTQVQIDKAAERTNRLLEVGLILRHQTVEAAVEAFDQQVLRVVVRALELGYRSGMSVSPNAWTALQSGNPSLMIAAVRASRVSLQAEGELFQLGHLPAAMFFAEAVKAAREYRETLKVKLGLVRQGNNVVGFERLNVGYTHTEEAEESISGLLTFLDERQECHQQGVLWPGVLAQIDATIEEILLCQRSLRHLQVNPKAWPRMSDVRTVDYVWLNSQVLLAALQAKADDEGFESVDQYLQAVRAIQSASEEKAERLVLARLLGRATDSFQEDELVWLRARVKKSVQAMRLRRADVFETGDTSVFVEVSETDWLPSSEDALAIAVGRDQESPERIRSSRRGEWLRTQVALAICWGQLDAEIVEEIVRAEVLPIETVVDGVLAMEDGEEKRRAARVVADAGAVGPLEIFRLLSSGLVDPDFDFVTIHLEQLSSTDLGQAAEMLFGMIRNRSYEEGVRPREAYHLLWLVFGRGVDPGFAKRFVDDPVRRAEMRGFMFECISSGDEMSDWEGYARIRVSLGDERHYHLVLGLLAALRATDYELPEEVDPGSLPVWAEIFTGRGLGHWDLRILGSGVTRAQAGEVLARISEGEAYRWIYAEDPDIDAVWARVAKARDLFFDPTPRHRSSGKR